MKRVIDPRVLSEETILDLLDFRIALEIGISSDIFRKITTKDIEELSEIVKMGIVFENNEYALISESAFHTKLYKITGNKIIQFSHILSILSSSFFSAINSRLRFTLKIL